MNRRQQHFALTYDKTTDHDSITVTAGIAISQAEEPQPGLKALIIAGSGQGSTMRYTKSPSDLGDAWIGLDAALEEYALTTTDVYRQTLEGGGGVVLQAPVVRVSE